MKKDISRSIKKNCSSSNFLNFKEFNNIHDEINGEEKNSYLNRKIIISNNRIDFGIY